MHVELREWLTDTVCYRILDSNCSSFPSARTDTGCHRARTNNKVFESSALSAMKKRLLKSHRCLVYKNQKALLCRVISA